MTASESIISAFLDLIAQKPFHNITVRNIIERAHVHRSTFYAYFSDIYDLREQLVTLACRSLEKSIPISHFLDVEPNTNAIADSIRQIHLQRDFFCAMLHPNMEFSVENRFTAIVEAHTAQWASQMTGTYPQDLFVKLYAANCLATIHWSLSHPEIDEYTVAKMISKHIENGFFKDYIENP